MSYRVLRPFAGHQVGHLLDDLVGHNGKYLLSAGFVRKVDDTKPEQKPARTKAKKRKAKP